MNDKGHIRRFQAVVLLMNIFVNVFLRRYSDSGRYRLCLKAGSLPRNVIDETRLQAGS